MPASLPDGLTFIPFSRVGPCVYFLFDGEEVVYVGQSDQSFMSRLECHARDGKVFDRVGIIPAPAEAVKRLALERDWMLRLRPKYNYELARRRHNVARGQPRWKADGCDHRVSVLRGLDDSGRPILERPITALDLPPRTTAVLVSNGLNFVSDLLRRSEAELLVMRGMGAKSFYAVRERLGAHGLTLQPGTVAVSSAALGLADLPESYTAV